MAKSNEPSSYKEVRQGLKNTPVTITSSSVSPEERKAKQTSTINAQAQASQTASQPSSYAEAAKALREEVANYHTETEAERQARLSSETHAQAEAQRLIQQEERKKQEAIEAEAKKKEAEAKAQASRMAMQEKKQNAQVVAEPTKTETEKKNVFQKAIDLISGKSERESSSHGYIGIGDIDESSQTYSEEDLNAAAETLANAVKREEEAKNENYKALKQATAERKEAEEKYNEIKNDRNAKSNDPALNGNFAYITLMGLTETPLTHEERYNAKKEVISTLSKKGATALTSNAPLLATIDDMDDNEFSVFWKLWNSSEDKNHAIDYVNYLSTDAYEEQLGQIPLALRQKARVSESQEGKPILQGATALYEGMLGYGESLYNAAQMFAQSKDVLGNSEKDPTVTALNTQRALDKKNEKRAEEGKEETKWVPGAMALETLQNVGNMIPSMVIGASSGISSLGATALGIGAAGQAYQEAINSGAEPDIARAYGTIIGISEAGLEYALGGINGLSGNVIGKLAPGVTNSIKSMFANVANKLITNDFARILADVGAEYLKDAAGEFIEEGLQEIIEPALGNWLLGKSDDISLENALYAGVLGAITAAGMNVPNSVASLNYKYASSKTLADSIQNAIDTGDISEIQYASNTPQNRALVQALLDINSSTTEKMTDAQFTNEIIGTAFKQIDGMSSLDKSVSRLVHETQGESDFSLLNADKKKTTEKINDYLKKYNESQIELLKTTTDLIEEEIQKQATEKTNDLARTLSATLQQNTGKLWHFGLQYFVNPMDVNASNLTDSDTTYNVEKSTSKFAVNEVAMIDGKAVDVKRIVSGYPTSINGENSYFIYKTPDGEYFLADVESGEIIGQGYSSVKQLMEKEIKGRGKAIETEVGIARRNSSNPTQYATYKSGTWTLVDDPTKVKGVPNGFAKKTEVKTPTVQETAPQVKKSVTVTAPVQQTETVVAPVQTKKATPPTNNVKSKVPPVTGDGVSRHAATIYSYNFNEEGNAEIEKMYKNNELLYKKASNEADYKHATDSVTADLEVGGWDTVKDTLKKMASFKSSYITSQDIAYIEYAAREAQNQGRIDVFGEAVKTASFIGTAYGQTVQALSMARYLTADAKTDLIKKLPDKFSKENREKVIKRLERMSTPQKNAYEKKVNTKKAKRSQMIQEDLNNIDVDGAEQEVNNQIEKLNKQRLNKDITPNEVQNALPTETDGDTAEMKKLRKSAKKAAEEQADINKTAEELIKQINDVKELKKLKSQLEKLINSVDGLTEEEIDETMDELSSAVDKYKSADKLEKQIKKYQEKTGIEYINDLQMALDALDEENENYIRYSDLIRSVAKYREKTGLNIDQLQGEINKLTAIRNQYESIKSIKKKIENLESKLGLQGLSQEERAKKEYDLHNELLGLRAYRDLVKKLDKVKGKTRLTIEVNLQNEINKLEGNVALSDDTIFELASAKTEEEFELARRRAYHEIGMQTQMNYIDYIDAWRYMAMLSGPKTIMRNFIGNIVNTTYVKTCQTVLGLGQTIAKPKNKTQAVINFTKVQDRNLMKYAYKSYDLFVENELKTGKRLTPGRQLIKEGQTTGSKFLDYLFGKVEKGDTFGSKVAYYTNYAALLNEGDTIFLKNMYATTLAETMKARGLTPNSSESALNDAKAYAIKVAQESCYHYASDFASELSRFEMKMRNNAVNGSNIGQKIGGAVGYIGISGIMPFKSVPTQILKSGVLDDTTIGIFKGAIEAKNGDPTGWLHMTQGLTGTGVAMLGAWLAAQQLIHGGDDDDDKKWQALKAMGYQNYSVDIANFNVGLSWVGPQTIPLFLGAKIYDIMKDGYEFKDILDVVGAVTSPITEMTVLSGVDDLVSAIEYNGWEGAVSEPLGNYLQQFSPALLASVNQTFIDKTRRSTSTTKGGGMKSSMEYVGNYYKQRTPIMSYQLPEWVNQWGEVQDTGTVIDRMWNNFFNIGNAKDPKLTDVDREILRLVQYEEDGAIIQRESVVPTTKTVKAIGEKLLNQEEMKDYKVVRGQTAYEKLDSLITTGRYKSLDDDTKAEAFKLVYKYADEIAKMSISPESRTDDTFILKSMYEFGGIPFNDAIISKAILQANGNPGSKDNIIATLKNNGYSEEYATRFYDYYKSSKKEPSEQFAEYKKKNNLS